MSIKINDNLTTVNYNTGNASRIKFIVIHYTGNNGDTAWGNTGYFKSTYRGASAHLFVDENSIWRCVADKDIAWHCGTSGAFKHPTCRNTNSIGIEMCSRKDSKGLFYIKDEVIKSTIELIKELMKKYNIPVENVLRHYDVTGKSCPEPFVRIKTQWAEFKKALITPTPNSVPTPAPTPNYKVSEANLTSMKNLGIINSPDYWRSVTNIQYLDALLSNAAKVGVCDARINNGVANIEKAFDILIDAGIISTPDYWKNLINSNVAYIDKLLINIANKCRIVLEKIVHAEAQGEGVEGQELVACVIMNRDKSSAFPNGIYNIVFQPLQFAPVANGAYAKAKPSDSVKIAVSNVLSGKDNSQGATYFCNLIEAQSPNNWHEKSLQFLFEFKNHRFYKVK